MGLAAPLPTIANCQRTTVGMGKGLESRNGGKNEGRESHEPGAAFRNGRVSSPVCRDVSSVPPGSPSVLGGTACERI
jgi:hypothetical protein